MKMPIFLPYLCLLPITSTFVLSNPSILQPCSCAPTPELLVPPIPQPVQQHSPRSRPWLRPTTHSPAHMYVFFRILELNLLKLHVAKRSSNVPETQLISQHCNCLSNRKLWTCRFFSLRFLVRDCGGASETCRPSSGRGTLGSGRS